MIRRTDLAFLAVYKYSWREVFTNLRTRQSTAFWDQQWCLRRLPDIDASSWRSISSTVVEPAMLSMLNA